MNAGHPLVLLAKVRTLLDTARRTPIPPQVPQDGTRGFAAVRLEIDRSDLDDLVREIDEALTGVERDFGMDFEAATQAVCALQSQARDELLVRLLAARGTTP